MKPNGVVIGACILLVSVILLHMGALSLGEWQKDEFRLATGLRNEGVWYMIHRFFSISPRPFSEILLWLYGTLVLFLHRPLIGEVLLAGWCGLLACCCGPLIGRSPAAPWRLFLGLALFCLFILGHPVADMFYWPMAMAAYIPTIGGLAVLTLLILDGRLDSRTGRMLAMMSLVIACSSSELGAMVVLPFTVFMLPYSALRKFGWGKSAWVLVPFALSVAILICGSIDRGINPTPLVTPTAHHLLPSLRAALPEALRAYAFIDPDDGNWGQAGLGSIAEGIPLKGAILIGFALVSRLCFARVERFPVFALAAACLAGVFGSVASAYLEFGFLCCQRHEAARQCLVILALLAAGGGLPAWPAHQRWRPTGLTGLACLMVAITAMFAWRLPDIRSAYAQASASHAHLARLWATGQSRGDGPAIMQQSDSLLVHAWNFPIGDHRTAPPRSDIFEAMRFFKKPELIVLKPQTQATCSAAPRRRPAGQGSGI